jgi:hypothetical protein
MTAWECWPGNPGSEDVYDQLERRDGLRRRRMASGHESTFSGHEKQFFKDLENEPLSALLT